MIMDEYPETTHGDTTPTEHTVDLRSRQSEARLPPEVAVEPAPRVSRTRDHILAGITACLVTGSVAVASVVYGTGTAQQPVRVSPAVAQVYVEETPRTPDVTNPYDTVAVGAEAYVVYDVRADRVLAAKNGGTVRPLASLTKIMTALVALETDYDASVPISSFALDTEGDSGLVENERWNLRDLVSFTLLTSSNDGADAIAASVGGLWQSTPESIPERVDTFVERMNTRARELGLSDMFFRNASGLDTYNGREGGAGTAEEVARLLAYVWEHHGEVLDDTALTVREYVSQDGMSHVAHNTNEYVEDLQGALGSKTGYTDLAGGNLTLIYDSGLDHPIVVVVLGSTREGRFADVERLVDATYEYIGSGWYAHDVAGSTRRM